MASGASKSAGAMYGLLAASGTPEIAVVVRLAGEGAIDQARRRRIAILAGRIARGEITFASAVKLTGDTQQFFSTVVHMRAGASGADAAPLDRAICTRCSPSGAPRPLPKWKAEQPRQQMIAAALDERGLVASILVHRGHSFWVGRTMSYVTSAARLVVLGSCGSATEVHAVTEASHEAQVIATGGSGETEINDHILKTTNDRLLEGGRSIE